ncbi:hypothetical protein EHZ19_10780 [Paraburkholderia bannensis]|nr:hypothetical protein [Paraburkholderia bannensis]RQM48680.1 hypothetical protein EHZ19_10780 [Paraburkholderia bannensis]
MNEKQLSDAEAQQEANMAFFNRTGGPFFPQVSDFRLGFAGATLRDVFAAEAMSAIIAGNLASGAVVADGDPERVAESALIFADALLAARGAK